MRSCAGSWALLASSFILWSLSSSSSTCLTTLSEVGLSSWLLSRGTSVSLAWLSGSLLDSPLLLGFAAKRVGGGRAVLYDVVSLCIELAGDAVVGDHGGAWACMACTKERSVSSSAVKLLVVCVCEAIKESTFSVILSFKVSIAFFVASWFAATCSAHVLLSFASVGAAFAARSADRPLVTGGSDQLLFVALSVSLPPIIARVRRHLRRASIRIRI